MLIVFVSIKSLNAEQGFDFVIASAGLLLPSIHLTSVISLLSYDCRRHIKSTISLFSYMVPSFTRQLYKDFESVQRIRGSQICNMASIVDLIAAPASNPWAIVYSSEARTLYITLLYLIDDQWSILVLLSLSERTITKPICNKRSWLLANKASIKTISFRDWVSSRTKCSPLVGLLSCYWSLLFSCFACSSFRLITCTAKERSNTASGCDTVAI